MRPERISERGAALLARLVKAKLTLPEPEHRVPLGLAEADACLQGGLARGALHEVIAEGGHETAATGFAAALAFRMARVKPVLWIRQDFAAAEWGEIAATGLLELGLDPDRLLLLRVAQAADVLRAGADALACGALGAVVLEIVGTPKALDFVASQRLMLAAARAGVPAFLLRFQASVQAGVVETRWHIRSARSAPGAETWGGPRFDATLARNRHGRTGRFLMQWRCDDGVFSVPPNFGAVAAPAFDRPAAAKRA